MIAIQVFAPEKKYLINTTKSINTEYLGGPTIDLDAGLVWLANAQCKHKSCWHQKATNIPKQINTLLLPS